MREHSGDPGRLRVALGSMGFGLLALAVLPVLADGARAQAALIQSGRDVAVTLDRRGPAPIPLNVEEIREKLSELARPWIVYRGVNFSAVLRITVDEEGRVRRVDLLDPCVPAPLKAELTEVARELRFKPALKDGEPVVAVVRLPVEFREGGRSASR